MLFQNFHDLVFPNMFPNSVHFLNFALFNKNIFFLFIYYACRKDTIIINGLVYLQTDCFNKFLKNTYKKIKICERNNIETENIRTSLDHDSYGMATFSIEHKFKIFNYAETLGEWYSVRLTRLQADLVHC